MSEIQKLAKQVGCSIDMMGYGEGNLEELARVIIQRCIEICDEEKADYQKHRKAAWGFEEKQIYAEGEAACDAIKYKMKVRFK